MAGTAEPLESPPRDKRRRLLPWLVLAAVLCSVAGFIGWRISRSYQPVRETLCKANVHKIAAALVNYHEQYGELPAAGRHGDDPQAAHSWRMRLLPLLDPLDIDAAGITTHYRYHEPWNSPHNRSLVQPVARSRYACPSGVEDGTLRTSYAAIVGPGTPWSDGRHLLDGNESDASPEKILVIEIADSDIDWNEPRDLTRDAVLAAFRDRSCVGGRHQHRGKIHCIRMDGRVEVLSPDIDIEELRQRLTLGD